MPSIISHQKNVNQNEIPYFIPTRMSRIQRMNSNKYFEDVGKLETNTSGDDKMMLPF